MIPSTIFLDGAQTDVAGAAAYYEDKRPGLSIDFIQAVREATRQIAEAPERWPEWDDRTRRFLLDRFPYFIIYAVHNNALWVVAVAHNRRVSDYWKDRLSEIGR